MPTPPFPHPPPPPSPPPPAAAALTIGAAAGPTAASPQSHTCARDREAVFKQAFEAGFSAPHPFTVRRARGGEPAVPHLRAARVENRPAPVKHLGAGFSPDAENSNEIGHGPTLSSI